jgi:hypothetical protein
MCPLVSWERDHKSDFDGEVHRGGVQKSDDSCWGGVGLEDFVIRGKDDEGTIWYNPLLEDGTNDFLLRLEVTEWEVLVNFWVVLGILPVPVTVDRGLHV